MNSPIPGEKAWPHAGRQARSPESARFIRFVVSGGVSAIVNLVSRYLLNAFISFAKAVMVAYLLGMVTAYVLGRAFVFERSGRTVAAEFWRFTAVNLFAAAQVWVISVGLGEYVFPASGFVWHPLDVAHFIGVTVPAFTSYLGHRHFSFARISPSGPTDSSDGRSAPERAG